jgi:hypothetical protein
VQATLEQRQAPSIRDDATTVRKIALNYRRNKQQDHTAKIDAAAAAFDYAACRDQWWNPQPYSLLWGTPLWDGATERQRVLLNQLYWVAYYSQIVSAEIATIYFNQTCAAGLYALEDFRDVCDMLDLESAQERAHINAFKTISEAVEAALFGGRLFTYPMRTPFAETMVHFDTNAMKSWWKGLQLRAFGLVSSSNAFLACQYFTVRGLRTLNGKLVQHELSRYCAEADDPEGAPIPSRVSLYHFHDESYHFNSSTILSRDVLRSVPKPTKYESMVANLGIRGCQKDHFHFSAAINGIFWYDPALYGRVYTLLTSPHFGLEHRAALEMMRRCFTEESDGLHESFRTHRTALESYKRYLEPLDYVTPDNKAMTRMAKSTVAGWIERNRKKFAMFEHEVAGRA